MENLLSSRSEEASTESTHNPHVTVHFGLHCNLESMVNDQSIFMTHGGHVNYWRGFHMHGMSTIRRFHTIIQKHYPMLQIDFPMRGHVTHGIFTVILECARLLRAEKCCFGMKL